jgi:gamma-glutamyl-gamma-aminobutyrate hydrolase PuuD
MTKPAVFIVRPSPPYVDMFKSKGWVIVDDLFSADMIQFTGGHDVSPRLYGEYPHRETYTNPNRDRIEAFTYYIAYDSSKKLAGICRGAQFLNVMCGGELWQHVNNHGIMGTHKARCEITNKTHLVTSTHHQMMRIGVDGDPLLVMTAKESTKKERVKSNNHSVTVFNDDLDIEALYYEKERCFCFQPHPEHAGHDKLKDLYFDYLNLFFDLK